MIFFPHGALVKLISTFAGDIIDIQDLIVSTAAGPAVRNSKAQTATATIGNSTGIGAYMKRREDSQINTLAFCLLASHEVHMNEYERDKPCC